MAALTSWVGSTVIGVTRGTATFSVCGTVIAVHLDSFESAKAIERLIAYAEQMAGDRARRSCAQYMRGAAAHMESQS